MNEIVLLVLAWLPVVFESGLFVVIAKFLAKIMKKNFTLPQKIVEESKIIKSEQVRLNALLNKLIEENKQLHEDNEALKMALKGFYNYGEKVKKN